jgi:hypothetical protein
MPIFLCKAVLNQATTSTLGLDWATSRRCLLTMADDHLDVHGLSVPFAEIRSAGMRIVPSAFFIPGCILSIETNSGTRHHLGLRYSSFWKHGLPFPVERQTVTVPFLWLEGGVGSGVKQ